MQDILTCAMGLDIHRDVIVACLAKGELGTDPEIEIRSFSTLIPEMRKLRDWVLEAECRYVAMESTGIYWQPIYEMLEPCFDGQISILVVNARHMKNVPGRKTDMRDAQWIATLLRAGLLKGSFIPDKTFRELRHLTRYRKSIVRDITAQKNRIDKFLQSSGFRFTAFLSDAFGASGAKHHPSSHGIRKYFAGSSGSVSENTDPETYRRNTDCLERFALGAPARLSSHDIWALGST